MGKIANAITGIAGTAILTTNAFFSGTQDEALQAAYPSDHVSPVNSSVTAIAAQDDGITVSDWLSGASDAIETAVEDQTEQAEIQNEMEVQQATETAETIAGSDPPGNENDNFGMDEEPGGENDNSALSDESMDDFGTCEDSLNTNEIYAADNSMSDFGVCEDSFDTAEASLADNSMNDFDSGIADTAGNSESNGSSGSANGNDSGMTM